MIICEVTFMLTFVMIGFLGLPSQPTSIILSATTAQTFYQLVWDAFNANSTSSEELLNPSDTKQSRALHCLPVLLNTSTDATLTVQVVLAGLSTGFVISTLVTLGFSISSLAVVFMK